MKSFYIIDKNGINLKTANTHVSDDINVGLTPNDKQVLIPENIKKGEILLGVTGTYEKPDGYILPSGKIEITNTEEINVTNYATAQVVDSNLSAENIKKDISILGVTGTFKGGSGEDRLKKILDGTKSTKYLFSNYKGTSVDDLISYSDTENVTDMEYMFSYCSNLQTIPQLDTSNVTNMRDMFDGCKNLQTVPLLNTSKVTSMQSMFYNCENLQSIQQLDTSNVTSTYGMFTNCYNLQSIPQLNTNKVTDIQRMFNMCSKLQTIHLSDTSNVTSMQYTFNGCTSLQSIPQLNTNKVTNIERMFASCQLLPKIDITSMDKITYSYSSNSAFYNCYSLTKLIIRTMTSIPVLNSNAFNGCYHFSGTVNATYNPQGLKDGRIYVPDNKVNELKQETNWSLYADIIVPLSTLIE